MKNLEHYLAEEFNKDNPIFSNAMRMVTKRVGEIPRQTLKNAFNAIYKKVTDQRKPLNPSGNDEDDFRELSVGSIEELMYRSYRLGYETATEEKAEQPPKEDEESEEKSK